MIYIYDGSFPGFLTAVHRVYYDGTSHMERIVTANEAGSLFSEEKQVDTVPRDAYAVAESFEKACGRAAAQWLYRGFLASVPGREEALYEYLRQGFRAGRRIYDRRMEPWVWNVFQRSCKVGQEADMFRGLVRFRELRGGLLYSEIRPTHDILTLIARHFQRRLPGVEWAILDAGRRRAVYCHERQLILADMAEETEPVNSSGEEELQRLWRNYYRHMAIPERYNPRLRRSFMPEKYWAYLTEMQPEKGAPGAGHAIINREQEGTL